LVTFPCVELLQRMESEDAPGEDLQAVLIELLDWKEEIIRAGLKKIQNGFKLFICIKFLLSSRKFLFFQFCMRLPSKQGPNLTGCDPWFVNTSLAGAMD